MIVNPAAHNGECLLEYPNISKLLHEEGVVCDPHFTERRFHAVELTVQAINEGYRKIIVFGGDGTLHEVVNGLFVQKRVTPTDVLLGVIGVGSNSEWLRNLGFSGHNNYKEVIRAIKAECSTLQDVGVVSYEESQYRQSRYMVSLSGTGFNSYVVRKLHHQNMKVRKRRWLDILCMVMAFFRYKYKGVKIYVDGKLCYNDLLFSTIIGIYKYNIGGMQQLPEAVADDGLLDVTLIRPLHFWHVMFRLHYLFNGELYKIGHTQQLRGRSIRIESTPDADVEVDGELLGDTPLEFSLLNRGLRIVVNEDFAAKQAIKEEARGEDKE